MTCGLTTNNNPMKSISQCLTLLLSACAVGPNYKPPAAPQTSGYAAPGAASTTASAPRPGGEAQHFVDGSDIPGEWWTLFKSPQLNQLIERGLAHSPTIDAAQAALRQANETMAAQRGAFYPSVSGQYQAQRAKESGAELGEPQLGSILYTLNSASVNVSYTLDAFGGVRRQVEALQAQTEYQRFALEASYLTLTANIVTAAVDEASLRAEIAATEQPSAKRNLSLLPRKDWNGQTWYEGTKTCNMGGGTTKLAGQHGATSA